MKHIELGKQGEQQAVKFLKRQKFKILQTNYKNLIGEIDIVALLKDTIVFVEVKTRSTLAYSVPAYAVTKHKQQKIRNVALVFLKTNKFEDKQFRFDVIEVLDGEINHIINAF